MENFFFKHRYFLLMLITVAAICLRFFQLGSVPVELNRDEASLGYTAYSLLKTGHEEHGVFWPIQIESFGDWKLPLYVYSLIPFIHFFGLAPWVIRLPSALAGVSIVISSFFLTGLLTKGGKRQIWFQLGVPLLLTFSPWEIHFSHVAYEAHLSLALFLWGLIGALTVLRSFQEQKYRRLGLLTGSAVLWSLTLLGYHSYQVFVPAFLAGMVWLHWPEWRRFFAGRKAQLAAVLAPLVLVVLVLIGSGAASANTVKFSGLSVFSLSAYTKTVDAGRSALPDLENPFFILAVNKVQALVFQVQTNFFRLISPEFLYLQGGANHGHNITGFGNFSPLLFFGLVTGIASIIIERKKWLSLLGMWVLAASIAPMITFEANHTTRFSPGFIALEILSVYGWMKILQSVQQYFGRKWQHIFLSALAIGLSYSVYQFLISYYFIFPQRDAQHWLWEMKPLVYFLQDARQQYDAVYIENEQYSPYIYFLVYEPADPAGLAERIEYYPADAEGFRHVRRLDNLYFQTIDWGNEAQYAGRKVLFVTEEHKIPGHYLDQPGTKQLMTLKNEWDPKGTEVWEYQGKIPQ